MLSEIQVGPEDQVELPSVSFGTLFSCLLVLPFRLQGPNFLVSAKQSNQGSAFLQCV
jgi:hypothetical protein